MPFSARTGKKVRYALPVSMMMMDERRPFYIGETKR